MVPVVAALSYKKDSFEPSETFRYACVGVKRSAEIWAHRGTRFGGHFEAEEEEFALDRMEATSSNEGCI